MREAQAAASLLGLAAVALCILVGLLRYNGVHAPVASARHTCKLVTTYEDGHTFTVVWDDPRACDRLSRAK